MKKIISILFIILSSLSFSATYFVEFEHGLSQDDIDQLKSKFSLESMERLSSLDSDYFQRTYEVKMKGESSLKLLEEAQVLSYEEPFTLIQSHTTESMQTTALGGYYFKQWALENKGDRYSLSLDGGGANYIQGVSGVDINWKGEKESGYAGGIEEVEARLDKIIKEDPSRAPVVAVIGQGIDYEHPELKKAILKNPKECDENGLPFNGLVEEIVDYDKNSLPGDCLGWNFAATSALDARFPQDEDLDVFIPGHETHVAGIIAAAHDDSGIKGVSDKIKILPIKVFGNFSKENELERIGRSYAKRLINGISYAIDKKVDVINLSLGWPRSLDNQGLRNVIQAALQRGIIVVASAGNSASDLPIYPCTYPGVICVGAIDPSGRKYSESNYGGHVDVFAPGAFILSTIPSNSISRFFGGIGYETYSGTSFAAPYVSATAAILKALYPDEGVTKISNRIKLGARHLPLSGGQSLNGALNFANAVNGKISLGLLPLLKGFHEIGYSYPSGEIFQSNSLQNQGIVFRFRNEGPALNDVKVQVEILSKGIQYIQEGGDFSRIEEGQVVGLRILGKVDDFDLDQQVLMRMTVNAEGHKTTFLHSATLMRIFDRDPKMHVLGVRFDKQPLALAQVNVTKQESSEGEEVVEEVVLGDSKFKEITQEQTGSYPLYYYPRYNEEKKDAMLHLFKAEGKNLLEFDTWTVSNIVEVLEIHALDLNQDEKLDYIIKAISELDGQRYSAFYYLDSEGEPLWGEGVSSFYYDKLDLERVPVKGFAFFKDQFKQKEILTPCLMLNTFLPDENQSHIYTYLPDYQMKARPICLRPKEQEGKNIYKKVSLVSKNKEEDLKKQLNLKSNTDLKLMGFSQKNIGEEIDLTLQVGEGVFANFYQLSFSFVEDQNPKLSSLFVGGGSLTYKAVLDLDTLETHDLYYSIRGKIFSAQMQKDNEAIYDEFEYENSKFPLIGLMASFTNKHSTDYFALSQNSLVFMEGEGHEISVKPLKKIPFVNNSILSEMYLPVRFKKGQENQGGIYVDSSQIVYGHLGILTKSEGKLVQPRRWSFQLRPYCKSMNPVYLGQKQELHYSMLCYYHKDKIWLMQYLKIDSE